MTQSAAQLTVNAMQVNETQSDYNLLRNVPMISKGFKNEKRKAKLNAT